MKLRHLAVLGIAAMVAACGDDDGAGPSSRSTAMFVNTDYMDWDSTSWEHWSAGSNAYAAVRAVGFPVDTFSGLTAADIHTHVSGKDILFFPEINNDPTFTTDAQDSIRAWVSGGGTVVVFSSGNNLDVFNTMFGLTLDYDGSYSSRLAIPRNAEASETPFGDGPASVPENDWTYYLTAGSIPDSAVVAYGEADGGTGGAVVVVPYGDGRVVFFGWSWGDGRPKGWQDGGWNELLALTARF
jgi:hypothetical protein